ncbi:hypothetical protein M427DRAFT_46115 [Gonapodya prolifera JEL478]|uniref:Uncharacterized protein n=1 Tax=Gonapodya prolifera (strain JEL478) TaxID=1344416 RepID=A0A139A843_GONPJ|nr:hypothetical protein M427DRAFT_46115 [Gonapodya prolifera JEL478]|eukprot:KXS12874.1 hypothetical protein M427DRAFT_46115 [Gonapodya prolifera JEL478]
MLSRFIILAIPLVLILVPGDTQQHERRDLVWSGIGHIAGWAANFRPDVYKGKPVLRSWQSRLDLQHVRFYSEHFACLQLGGRRRLIRSNPSKYVILNQHYEVIKTVTAGRHRLGVVHQFRIVDGTTVLIETSIPRHECLARWGRKLEGQNWILSGGFQELDVETGRIVFEWQSLDHVNPSYSTIPLSEGLEGSGLSSLDAWNYFNINSVDKDDQGNYLVSARNYATIFKINGTSGAVIWQLGGFFNRSTFALGEHTFDAPDGILAPSQGNNQILPNSNAFVNWGQAGAITGFDCATCEVLFHAYLDSAPAGLGVESYRSFRFNWMGTPSEEPAVAAVQSGDQLKLYASWNEDTETTLWQFYEKPTTNVSDAPTAIFLGEVKRGGFETALHLSEEFVSNENSLVFAVAVGKGGITLGISRDVAIDVVPFSEWAVHSGQEQVVLTSQN